MKIIKTNLTERDRAVKSRVANGILMVLISFNFVWIKTSAKLTLTLNVLVSSSLSIINFNEKYAI